MEKQIDVLIGVAIGIIVIIAILSLGPILGSALDPSDDVSITVTFTEDPADGDAISIVRGSTTETYEFDYDGSITAGNIRVVPAGH